MKVQKYSHHFVVSGFNKEQKTYIHRYAMRYGQMGPVRVGPGKFIQKIVRVFAVSTLDNLYYRFHINQLEEFYEYMATKGCPRGSVVESPAPSYVITGADFDIKSWVEARDYQEVILEEITGDSETQWLVPLQTGKGKTATFFIAASRIKHTAAMIIKPMYIDKWISDFKEIIEHKKGDLMVIRGSAALITYMNLAKAGELKAKFYIFSNKTLAMYFKHLRDNNGDLGPYPLPPEELFSAAGIGLRGIDEVHQDYHSNWVLDCHTHVNRSISLSATFLTEDTLLQKLYKIMFPRKNRATVPEWEKYIVAKALVYGMKDPHKVKYMNNALNSYSHIKFEQSLHKLKRMMNGYLDIIEDTVETSYISRRKPGTKMLVFASLVETCDTILERLQKKYPDLDIRRYTSDDDYANVQEADIVVSTIKSAGTAIDIPGLISVLMTDSVDSIQANVQALGRLRKPKFDLDVEFLYLVCRDIQKQVTYHERKKEKFKGKVLNHMTYVTRFTI